MRSACVVSGEDPGWPEISWRALFDRPEGDGYLHLSLLLEDGNRELCGWITGVLSGGTAELEFIWVVRKMRRFGHGRTLLRHWLTLVVADGAEECFLEVRAANAEAQHLYRALGFAEINRRRLYYQCPPDDGLVMRLNLAGS